MGVSLRITLKVGSEDLPENYAKGTLRMFLRSPLRVCSEDIPESPLEIQKGYILRISLGTTLGLHGDNLPEYNAKGTLSGSSPPENYANAAL